MSNALENLNGCSLEDCHTNLFALTDLAGIKWRQYKCENTFCVDPLDDPVLQSFTKCIQSDILCVWRKIKSAESSTPLCQADLACSKDLWIFWYGVEPANLPSLLSPDLQKAAEGAWEDGLRYECRLQLFKSLHNLIERCLISQKFVRLGKWFVQPHENLPQDKRAQLSIRFSFFLHGQTTVCASIDVRHHTQLRRLQASHLQLATQTNSNVPVLLAPYGLTGELTGRSWASSDPTTSKLLDEWMQFYPLEKESRPKYDSQSNETESATRRPAAVEVTTGGVRMRYPAEYVLVTAETEATLETLQQRTAATTDPIENATTTQPQSNSLLDLEPGLPVVGVVDDLSLASRLLVKSWQDSNTTFSRLRHNKEKCDSRNLSPSKAGRSELAAVTSRERHWSHKDSSRQKRGFHKRTAGEEASEEMYRSVYNNGKLANNMPNSFNPVAAVTVTSAPSTVEESTSHSSVHSPLVATPVATETDEPQECAMPALSPQQQTAPQKSKPPATKDAARRLQQLQTATTTSASAKKLIAHNHPLEAQAELNAQKLWIASSKPLPAAATLNRQAKRPYLAAANCDGESVERMELKNLVPVKDWLERPIKRARKSNPQQELVSLETSPISPTVQSCVKSPKAQNIGSTSHVSRSDPYKFPETDDDVDGVHQPFRCGRGDDKSLNSLLNCSNEEQNLSDSHLRGTSLDFSPPTPGPKNTSGDFSSLRREQDLKPCVKDLENIFDTDGDSPAEIELHGESVTLNGTDVHKWRHGVSNHTQHTAVACVGGPSSAELSKMFPTPPSLETAMSPSVGAEADCGVKQEVKTENEPIDQSLVYRPNPISFFVTATKYNSITLPSDKMEPVSSSSSFPMLYTPSWFGHNAEVDALVKSTVTSSMPPPPPEYTQTMQRTPGGSESIRSPAFYGNASQQRTPMSFDLQSPASNSSSCLNRTIPSVEPPSGAPTIPETNSLLVNLYLQDSVLNIFKDQNFDSCSICVCNLNIKGTDIDNYIVERDKSTEPDYNCVCGFSAAQNRRYGTNSGLFYEDEVEISGMRHDNLERRRKAGVQTVEGALDGPEPIYDDVMDVLVTQYSTAFPSGLVNSLANNSKNNPQQPFLLTSLDLHDSCEATHTALEKGMIESGSRMEELSRSRLVHPWAFMEDVHVPRDNARVIQLLKHLQPYLNDALQRKRATALWDLPYQVSGPLTWKDFHLMAGRGSDEASTPQPVPPLLAGSEREWVSIAPGAIKFWDKLLLEPVGRRRNIAYMVVSPENDHILANVRLFFKELSITYEQCRLGTHLPFPTLRDGIMRVGRSAAGNLHEQKVDEWFSRVGDDNLTSKLKLYAQVCRGYVGPLLRSRVRGDKYSLSEKDPKSDYTPGSNDAAHHGDDKENEFSASWSEVSDDSPHVVVYLVDPFLYGEDGAWQQSSRWRRVAMLGMLRCYTEVIASLPTSLRNQTQLQIIPLHMLLDIRECVQSHYLQMLALSVFAQCRRLSSHHVLGKSLTGFGPSASAAEALRASDQQEHSHAPMRIYEPPFVVSQLRVPRTAKQPLDKRGSDVLLVTYCLSDDQRWLIAVCTDNTGSLLEHCVINIDIPNRNRRKKTSARKVGMLKLWDFILGVISSTVKPWRLVVGRFGRLGHGEIEGWCLLLSKKNLARECTRMRDACNICSGLDSSQAPSIVSACVVSMEIHPSIMVTTDMIKEEEKKSSAAPLHSPDDASVTHILVIPTSATASPHEEGAQMDEKEDDMGIDMVDIGDTGGGNMDDIMGIDINNLDMDEIFRNVPGSPEANAKSSSAPNSPNSSNNRLSAGGAHKHPLSVLDQEDGLKHLIQEQPLAMGFFVSTAPTGPLPHWIRSNSSHNKPENPTCFKASLHVHTAHVQQLPPDYVFGKLPHPLDSSFTCDVLRCVLETYNALSWLTIDPCTNDRRSCLPIHMVVLLQLYHAFEAFV